MTYEMKNDTATLFKNDRKEKDTQPDYTGKIKQDGKERQLAAWITKSKDGSKTYMSLKISDFLNAADGIREGMGGRSGSSEGGRSHEENNRTQPDNKADLDDDLIPF